MKEYIKVIIGFIIGVILASSITVYAYSYLASDVSYTRNNTTTSVSNALDDLYNKANELNTLKSNINQTDAIASSIVNGKKAYTINGLITGTLDLSKVYADGDKIYENGKLEINNLSFTPSVVFLYKDSGIETLLKGTSSGCWLAYNKSPSDSSYTEWSECFTMLSNGFRFTGFADEWTNSTYHWIAIK